MTVDVLGKDIELKSGDIQFSSNQDFSIISKYNNLHQSISNRIQTIKGEYSNAEYGSEVYRVIGKPKNILMKSALVGYVVEALNQEPRIRNIENVSVDFDLYNKFRVNLNITIVPIDSQEPLNLVFPLFLTS